MLEEVRDAIEYLRRKDEQIVAAPELARRAIEHEMGKAISLAIVFALAGHWNLPHDYSRRGVEIPCARFRVRRSYYQLRLECNELPIIV